MDGLVLHCDSREVTREKLAALPEPESLGPHHRPVRLGAVVDVLEAEVVGSGLEIGKQRFGLSGDGARLFGVFVMRQSAGLSYAPSLGFRASTDESMALRGVAGANVFVCDNMAFSGSEFVFSRKFTTWADIAAVIRRGLQRWLAHQATFAAEIAWLEAAQVTDSQAQAFFCEAIRRELLPAATVAKALRMWFEPEGMPDVAPRSRWGIHNAFTRALGPKSLAVQMGQGGELTRALLAA